MPILKIGTELNSDKFEQQMNALEKKYANKEIDVNLTASEYSTAENEVQKINDALERNYQLRESINKKLKEEEQSQYRSGTAIDMYKTRLEEINAERNKMLDAWFKQREIADKLEAKLEKQRNDLSEIADKIDSINAQQINANVDNINKGLKGVVKKVAKWGLAIVGIRSAYMGIRKAMNMVQSNNEKIANTFKVMGLAISNALTPLVEKIVNVMKTIMLYIDYIYFKLTSKHLFDFSKAFSDANKNAQGTAKAVDKMTAGFDEMNVMQDNSSAGGGGGMAENPFEGWENFKPPKWLEKLGEIIEKLAKIVKKYWKGIVVALIVAGVALIIAKLASLISKFGGTKEALTGLGGTFKGFFDGLGKGIEAIAILGGLALVIKTVTDLIDTFSQSGMKVTEVVGLMATIFGTIIALMGAIVLLGPAMTAGLVPFSVLMAEISAILIVMSLTLPTILEAVGNFITSTAPSLIDILETIGKNITNIIYALGTVFPPIIQSVGDVFGKIFDGIAKIIKTVGDVIVNIMTTAKNLVTTVLEAIIKFINDLGPAINRFVDNAIRAVTKLINFMISGIEYMINTLVIGAIRAFINKINDVIPGSEYDLKAPSNVYIPRFTPQLAKGGIINMPGRGVPVGGGVARAGERGQEGVIPLTDSQQMALLGEAIGKYISINATVPVYVGNRMVAREMKRIEAEDNFAYNR